MFVGIFCFVLCVVFFNVPQNFSRNNVCLQSPFAYYSLKLFERRGQRAEIDTGHTDIMILDNEERDINIIRLKMREKGSKKEARDKFF